MFDSIIIKNWFFSDFERKKSFPNESKNTEVYIIIIMHK